MDSSVQPPILTKDELKDLIANDLLIDSDLDMIIRGLKLLSKQPIFPLKWRHLTISNVDELQTILFKAHNHDIIIKMLNDWADKLQYNFPTYYKFSKYEVEDDLQKIINTRHRQ